MLAPPELSCPGSLFSEKIQERGREESFKREKLYEETNLAKGQA